MLPFGYGGAPPGAAQTRWPACSSADHPGAAESYDLPGGQLPGSVAGVAGQCASGLAGEPGGDHFVHAGTEILVLMGGQRIDHQGLGLNIGHDNGPAIKDGHGASAVRVEGDLKLLGLD